MKQNKNKNKYKPKEEKKQKNDSESEEEIPKKKEPIYIPPPSSYQLEYKLGNVILTIQGFIIDGATQCRIDEDVSSDDEDDEIVHEYHIKFTMTKKCILNYLKMLNTENNEKNINETIFLFMYDLSDFTTFERMMLYYDSLNRKFGLKKNKIKPPKEEKKKKDEDEEENPDEPRKKKEPFHMPPPSSNQLEYKLGSTILTIQAFIIDGAIQCRIDEDVSSDDEDEEIVHEYHIKFTWTKKTILNYLRMFADNTNEKNTNEDIFVFMYDLSDFSTFERMMLYYDSVNRRFKLHENKAKCVIIGNKSEKKMLFNKEDLEKMDSFYNLNESFQKFEISNKLHFNFSKFLNELIENCIDMNYDKEKLKSILENKFTFNKAKRVGMQIR